jgi:hypothetical protein
LNKKIWDSQKEFNKKFFSDRGLDLENLSIKEKVKWAKEFYFHINKEMTDLINCLPHWKMHYQNEEVDQKLIKSNLKEEFIDAFKYFMGLGQVLGISYDKIIDVYEAKTEVVEQKYKQNLIFNELKNQEIIMFDIDGVINNYPDCYLDWVADQTKTRYVSMDEIKEKLDIQTYEEIKEKYRLSGVKSRQPINEDTRAAMQKINQLGLKIVIYTSRPVSRYKRIFSDTLKWLKNNNIPFEAINWTDFQKEDFYKLGLNIRFIVEDDIVNAKLFSSEGYKVYLLNKDHNQGYNHELIVRIDSALEILSKEGM